MLARPARTPALLVALLSALLTLTTVAEEVDSPSTVTNQYLLTAQRLALFWVETRPWPSHYTEFLSMTQEELAPMLSQAALEELRSKSPGGPKELLTKDSDPDGGDDAIFEGMMACVAKAHFTVLSEDIVGDKATVEVETTVADPFGSGKTESFQDKLVLVRENGRWVLTPEAFKTFVF